MPKHADFLVEIHTAELPPKSLLTLAKSFCEEIKKRITEAELTFREACYFATPRRLAVTVKHLVAKQADSLIERRGPAFQAAYDDRGQPTPACIGFARSCGITPDQLLIIENKQGKWVGYQQAVAGKTAQDLLPDIVRQALSALPIAKRMRWGSGSAEFVRPVYSVILMFGSTVIEAEILGLSAGKKTQGHRFLCKKELNIGSPASYANKLEKNYVIADFELRKNKIRTEATAIVQRELGNQANVQINDELLNEVTGLVEWPVALLGTFDSAFLRVPQEALISAMQDHQRYFPVVDLQNKLLPYFVAINNIESRQVEQVITGHQRVLRARLSDAAFFFETDKKIKLSDRLEKLKTMVFQAKLGSLYDKAERIAALAAMIASELKLDVAEAKRAGLLCKADLTTELVGEFPELQGIAGYYYALENEGETIAKAIKEHYQPRFSGDALPSTPLGSVLALADRLDTLGALFSIGIFPTGDKDPYGLRRAAMGILRILIENKLNLDMRELLAPTADTVWQFMLERLKPWYQDQGIGADIFAAVSALNLTKPYDIHRRIQAVKNFKNLPEAEALSIANKRVSNILAQSGQHIQIKEIDEHLFEHEAEHQLFRQINEHTQKIAALTTTANYQEMLTQLASLREPVDRFFDHVMVMVEDPMKRENRLLMLKKLRELFLQVADIALLQS